MARVLDEVGGAGPVVLLEAEDGTLEVVDATAEFWADLPGLTGTQLDDHVVADDRPVLERTRQLARTEQRQHACDVRLLAGSGPDHVHEVRFLPGLQERTVVLLRDVTRVRRLGAEAALLRRVTELANAGTDIGQVATTAIGDLRTTMGWRGGHVLAVRPDGQLERVGSWDLGEQADGPPPLAAEAGDAVAPAVVAAAVSRREPVTSQDVDPGSIPSGLAEHGVGGVVALPIVADGEVVRVLELVAADSVVLDADQRSLLGEVGRQLGSVAVRQDYLDQVELSHAELARSNAELERFAYVASHDLQEPLRKIIGFTELLEAQYEPRDDEEREYRQYVVDSAHRLQRLIKDLLAYSRAGRRELAQEPVELDVVVAQAVEDLGMAIAEADASVEVAELPVVLGDDGQLREVVQNLLSNALKYRAEGRAARIVVSGSVEGDVARLVIADNGIGVALDQRSAVFEVFRRLHPAHLYGGTGLGLALVERIVHRHGGTVALEDSPLDGGIAAHVTLPTPPEQP